MMRKRGRENPCYVCGHYHKFEEGEVCGICGHKKSEPAEGAVTAVGAHLSAFPSEIIPDFLYLGTYDNASRSELLKAQGISHILNVVPTCPNLYRNSFTYFSMPESTTIPYDDCFEFLEQARNGGARVLVHCMSGLSKSPSVVAAYLMRRDGISLEEAVSVVKAKRPPVNITQAIMEQLIQYESSLKGRVQHPPPGRGNLQQHQQPGFPHFDISTAVAGQNSSSGAANHLTFLGGASGAQESQQHAALPVPGPGPVPGLVPPMFAFQPSFPVPPDGFVFGAGNAPPQGSEQ